MALQAQLDATLTTGPACVSDTTFPGDSSSIPLQLYPPQKQYVVEAKGTINVSTDATTFQAVTAIGFDVAQVTTFYARSLSPMRLQMTFKDPAGGPDIVIIEPLQGVKLSEYPSTSYLKSLAINGSGTVNFWAAGTQ